MTIGAAASWEGIAAVSAMPRQQKAAAPATRVTRIAGRRSQGRATPYRTRPIAAISASISRATTIELPTRPAMKTQGGIGVPRLRFSRPSSRAITSDIASDCIVAEITERVMIAGT